jgi:hypothetical protein
MHKCYLTADCEIGNQTNRIVYLNIDLAIEIEMWIIVDKSGDHTTKSNVATVWVK